MSVPPNQSAASAPPTRTVFFGSGTFAVPVLQALLTHDAIEVVGVVTPPDRPAGRSAAPAAVPVAIEARERGLPLLQPGGLWTPEAAASIEALRPDLGVLADFGWLVPPTILAIPPHGILNVHPSLLPSHRGATPIPATILAGDAIAGVTVMQMDAGLDTGPVIDSRAWPLDGTETAPELETRAATEGADLLLAALEPYLRGERPAQPQAGVVSLTRPLRREDGRLDPRRTAVELEREVRAYLPWPGSYLPLSTGRLVVLKAAVTDGEPDDSAGLLIADGDGLALVARTGRLRLLEVQAPGGRPMSVAAFRRGHPGVIGHAADDGS